MKVKVKKVSPMECLKEECMYCDDVFKLNKYVHEACSVIGESRELWEAFRAAAKDTDGFNNDVMIMQMFLAFCLRYYAHKTDNEEYFYFKASNHENGNNYFFETCYIFDAKELYYKGYIN